ncbi:MAG: hypothetical protein M3O71_26050 [Bacteroidota bacterium]|nr:hypothetical protein [Bacteroidota bacterium]
MKYSLSCIFIFLVFASKAWSQTADTTKGLIKYANPDAPCLPAKQLAEHIGLEVYICDTIVGYKTINSSLRLLYLGKKYPNQLATIIIKGRKLNEDLLLWTDGFAHFRGKAIMYKGKPAIVITQKYQTATEVML